MIAKKYLSHTNNFPPCFHSIIIFMYIDCPSDFSIKNICQPLTMKVVLNRDLYCLVFVVIVIFDHCEITHTGTNRVNGLHK